MPPTQPSPSRSNATLNIEYGKVKFDGKKRASSTRSANYNYVYLLNLLILLSIVHNTTISFTITRSKIAMQKNSVGAVNIDLYKKAKTNSIRYMIISTIKMQINRQNRYVRTVFTSIEPSEASALRLANVNIHIYVSEAIALRLQLLSYLQLLGLLTQARTSTPTNGTLLTE